MATIKQSTHEMTSEVTTGDALEIARHWEAGEAGCGALILGLQREMAQIEAGTLLQVTALDAAASIDIPAWCDMTGHTLIVTNYPTYVLKKRTTKSPRSSH